MTKKSIAKKYLRDKINFKALKADWKNSWIKGKPIEYLFYNGLASKHCNYDLMVAAIEKADYKHKTADRTWQTIIEARNELILEVLK